MKQLHLIVWSIGLLLGSMLPVFGQVDPDLMPPVPPVAITDIKAHLFYEEWGHLSGNLFDQLQNPDFSLWNTIIGEGSAGGFSSSLMVVVEVTGDPDIYPAGKTIEVEILGQAEPLLQETTELVLFNDRGKQYLPFFMKGTGCRPLTIKARTVGQRPASSMEKTVPFQCGE